MSGVTRIGDKEIRIKIGTSFCHVDRTRQAMGLREAITFGNQKWSGGRPAFSRRAAGRAMVKKLNGVR